MEGAFVRAGAFIRITIRAKQNDVLKNCAVVMSVVKKRVDCTTVNGVKIP